MWPLQGPEGVKGRWSAGRRMPRAPHIASEDFRHSFEAQSLGGSIETIAHTAVLGLQWEKWQDWELPTNSASSSPLDWTNISLQRESGESNHGACSFPLTKHRTRTAGARAGHGCAAAHRFGESSMEPGLPEVPTIPEQTTIMERGGTDSPCSRSPVITGSLTSRSPP